MPTEAKEIFEATSRSFRELMSENGLGFYIPAYQRPYGWDSGKVARLIDDTLHGLATLVNSDDSFTFLGTIITIHDINHTTIHPKVKDEVPGKVLTVIDGQQRLCSLLLMAVCLHSQMRLRHGLMFKGAKPEDPALEWLSGQSLHVLKTLATTIYETQAYGDSPIYPRMIRAFKDQWSRKKQYAQYESPIANLLASYSSMAEDNSPSDFRPKPREQGGEGEEDLVKRYLEIRLAMNNLAKGKKDEDGKEEMPDLLEIASNRPFQRALLNHELPDAVVEHLKNPTASFAELIRLLFVGAYVLNRTAVTVVKGKNETYAFTIFESLNTTGEPLTAFETFKPRVVSAEGLAEYEGSKARTLIDHVSEYLSTFKVGSGLQTATQDLLTSFASAETGHKLAKRLPDQRTWLKEEFDRHSEPDARIAFVRHLRDATRLVQHLWDPAREGTPHLYGLLPEATSDQTRLCVSFLRSLNHTIVVGPLVRFYASALQSPPDVQIQGAQDFEGAIKAIAAFSALWRTSRRTTGNIDREYREIMAGIDSVHIGPLARTRRRGHEDGPAPEVRLAGLKQELIRRLNDSSRGGVSDKKQWVQLAATLPIYQTNKALARFVLLSAYHDTVEDKVTPGLVCSGKEDSGRCLTFDGWRNEKHLSLEHIVPQKPGSGWLDTLYSNKDTVDAVGNLVLVPAIVNSSLGNRPWQEKRVLYAALGARSKEEARALLDDASKGGVTFAQSTEDIVELSQYMPHLASVGQRIDSWTPDFIEARSRRLLELSWDRLAPWLGLDESSNGN